MAVVSSDLRGAWGSRSRASVADRLRTRELRAKSTAAELAIKWRRRSAKVAGWNCGARRSDASERTSRATGSKRFVATVVRFDIRVGGAMRR